MSIVKAIQPVVSEAIQKLYQHSVEAKDLVVSETKPEFEGDYTVVLFSFVKAVKKSPEVVGKELGDYLIRENSDLFGSYNVIKGFLNLTIKDGFWLKFLTESYSQTEYGKKATTGRKVIVEYSSPNTNKPLHLGHLRNNFLGWSIAEIFKYNGYEVVKTCIANDRGIHICKSMIAWQLFAKGASPESTGIKGDHLVGDYYVMFGNVLKQQIEELIQKGLSKDEAEKQAPIMKAAQQMLVDWEAGKPEVIDLWKKMNSWVYAGFEETYRRIGSDFDKTYYESDTYLLGKEMWPKDSKEEFLNKKQMEVFGLILLQMD